ncbi:MAG TPA: DUF2807 domain-containing protein [Aliidongia sp.]|uniref:GIN domain-containing protein n=1 Tax=Aliidongia sp. TaxID=1914230 RepID=UPI002DDD8BC2|nr:DUF2807 domain-containing protein [Aliidongia sp.]HEV2674205.1 DUF2807 domain-containing protein [Aliidongia sp.]
MSRHSISVAAATLTVLSLVSLSARAETVNQTLDGKSLAVDVTCVDQVEIQPQADLAGKVTVEATSTKDGELKDFVFAGGETASVRRDHHTCITLSIERPKIRVSIHVPAGMPIDIRNGGSTDYVIGAVGGVLHAQMSGSGNLKAEHVTDLGLGISGSSDVRIGQATGPTEIRISGSGDVKIGNADMPGLKIDVRGSGSVSIDQGQVGALTASVAGSGDLRIKATAGDATLSTVGSGDIDVAKVTGKLINNKVGSGTIRVGKS